MRLILSGFLPVAALFWAGFESVPEHGDFVVEVPQVFAGGATAGVVAGADVGIADVAGFAAVVAVAVAVHGFAAQLGFDRHCFRVAGCYGDVPLALVAAPAAAVLPVDAFRAGWTSGIVPVQGVPAGLADAVGY